MTAVKVGISRQVVIPKKLYDQLGLTPGDYLEVKREGDRIILTPKTLIEKHLAESFEDFRKGKAQGPFGSAKEAIRALKKKPRRKTSG